jgi:hypothetical protein
VKAIRGFIETPRLFDPVVVTLAGILVLGAYVTAYAYVIQPNQLVQPTYSIGLYMVLASWLALTSVLAAAFAAGLRAGRPTASRALPDGYVGSLAAALVSARLARRPPRRGPGAGAERARARCALHAAAADRDCRVRGDGQRTASSRSAAR